MPCRPCAARWRAASIRSGSCWIPPRRAWAACGPPSASAYDRLRRRLDSLVGAELGSALQEPIVTLRNGRYVVPVKAEARAKVKGIVHDASGSGQTLFIEPLVVVELGNAWREAQVAEAEEVARILDELSAFVAANAGPPCARRSTRSRASTCGPRRRAWRPTWTAFEPRPRIAHRSCCSPRATRGSPAGSCRSTSAWAMATRRSW